MKTVRLKISGRVQGVFFRESTKDEANNLGVKGWIRNEPDGTVLIEAVGNEKDVDKLIKWCREGSELARVERVEVEELKSGKDYKNFEIKY